MRLCRDFFGVDQVVSVDSMTAAKRSLATLLRAWFLCNVRESSALCPRLRRSIPLQRSRIRRSLLYAPRRCYCYDATAALTS